MARPIYNSHVSPKALVPQVLAIHNAPVTLKFGLAFQYLTGTSRFLNAHLPYMPTSTVDSDALLNVSLAQEQCLHFEGHESVLSRLIGKRVLGFAIMNGSLPPDHSTGCACQPVYLTDFEEHPLLTDLAFDSQLSKRARSYTMLESGNADWVLRLYEDVSEQLRYHKVLVVRRVVDRNKVAGASGLLALTVPIASAVTGLCSRQIMPSLALGFGILGIASYMLAIALWYRD